MGSNRRDARPRRRQRGHELDEAWPLFGNGRFARGSSPSGPAGIIYVVAAGTSNDEHREGAPCWFAAARAALTLAPAIAAASVALLYTVGALLFSAEIIGADLTPGETLTFVPLQQILARGVGTMVAAVVVIPGVGLSLWGVIRLDRATPLRRGRKRWGALRSTTLAVGVVLLLAGLVAIPPLIGAGILVAAIVLAFLDRLIKPSLLTAYLALLSFALVLLIAAAFLYPSPLPRATIELDTTSHLRGGLVVHSDDTWVITSRAKRLTAVHDNNVTRVEIGQPEHRVQSTYELITGRRPPYVR